MEQIPPIILYPAETFAIDQSPVVRYILSCRIIVAPPNIPMGVQLHLYMAPQVIKTIVLEGVEHLNHSLAVDSVTRNLFAFNYSGDTIHLDDLRKIPFPLFSNLPYIDALHIAVDTIVAEWKTGGAAQHSPVIDGKQPVAG